MAKSCRALPTKTEPHPLFVAELRNSRVTTVLGAALDDRPLHPLARPVILTGDRIDHLGDRHDRVHSGHAVSGAPRGPVADQAVLFETGSSRLRARVDGMVVLIEPTRQQ